ncbi:MAG: Gfo/Idh/MocA family oxidoreductase [Planctomycetota bacterium]
MRNDIEQHPDALPAGDSSERNETCSRREFLHTGSAALAAAAIATYGGSAFAQSGDKDIIKIGLVGCGGRGTGAAVNAMSVDPNVRLVAMADTFGDRLASSLGHLKDSHVGEQVQVDAERCFTGFEGFHGVIENSDVVLLATPPHFRPEQLAASVTAGKHVFCEKPVATDAPGVRAVMETCKQARQKRLSVVSGLCYRYQDAKQEIMRRVHDGAVGDITALQCTYNTGGLWHRGRKLEWSDMEWQVRNWLYFTWLSGDHIVEQSIHSIDKLLWAMQDRMPLRCVASGGRIVRTDDDFGNIYDHFNTTYEWEGGIKGFHSCRQWPGADSDVSDYAFGTKGTAMLQHHRITGENEWRFQGQANDMYEAEMAALFRAVRKDEPINDGDYMCKSTLMAIMGRMAAYTGKVITSEQALNSTEKLGPDRYSWSEIAVEPIAQPGQTPFL